MMYTLRFDVETLIIATALRQLADKVEVAV